MNSMKFGWTLVFALGLGSCGPPAEESEEASSEVVVDEVAAARSVAESWDPMMNGADLDGMMSLFTNDAVRLDPESPIASGADAIRASFKEGFDTSTFESSNPIDEIRVDGHWAFARGTFRDRTTNKQSGETLETTGKWVSILRKTPDGWKYALDIWNRDAPLSSPSEAADVETTATETPGFPAPSAGAETDALRALTSSWDEAYSNRDADALVALYTDDARRMPADEPAHVGREAIRASFQADLEAAGTGESKTTILGMEAGEEWAYLWGTWSEKTTDPASEDSGKWLNIARRTPDGWKDYLEIWNRDR